MNVCKGTTRKTTERIIKNSVHTGIELVPITTRLEDLIIYRQTSMQKAFASVVENNES